MKIRPQRSLFRLAYDRLLQHRASVVGLFFISALVMITAWAPWISQIMGLDPYSQNVFHRFLPPLSEVEGRFHILGTDEVGRDVFIRLIYGARVSIGVGLTVAIASAIVGAIVGSIAGYFGRWVDAVLMRITDSLLALPLLPLLIVFAAVDLSKNSFFSLFLNAQSESVSKLVLILCLFSWMTSARLVRSRVLSLREQEFVVAARSLGAHGWRIIFGHLLPNAVGPLLVAVTVNIGSSILYEAALSFLGLGIQPPLASWGNMLSNAQEIVSSAPALAFAPGFLIFLTVISFNFLGEGLQAAFDPQSRKQ